MVETHGSTGSTNVRRKNMKRLEIYATMAKYRDKKVYVIEQTPQRYILFLVYD